MYVSDDTLYSLHEFHLTCRVTDRQKIVSSTVGLRLLHYIRREFPPSSRREHVPLVVAARNLAIIENRVANLAAMLHRPFASVRSSSEQSARGPQ